MLLIDYARGTYLPVYHHYYMTQTPLDLKTRFRMALAAVEMTQSGWAEAEGYNPNHLSLVLNEKRESKKLIGKIEDFTTRTLRKVKAA